MGMENSPNKCSDNYMLSKAKTKCKANCDKVLYYSRCSVSITGYLQKPIRIHVTIICFGVSPHHECAEGLHV